ncbi:class II aldolase/adducin family protein [Candidatus Poriferisodalis sp.]|uniref:class II aldolase/adducin family protein n=1 Tax=Candidatus Poriferisodalis sp. TaxID=3101277 RepID=UPI003B0253F3
MRHSGIGSAPTHGEVTVTEQLPPVDLDKTVDAMDTPDRSIYSGAEWTARTELAALYRAIHLYGMSDLVNGAIGARVPDQPNHYLTHPYGMYWEEATASSFVTVTPDGEPVHDDKRWTNDGAVNLCHWIFGSRSDINFFIHGHEEAIAAVGSLRCGLLWVNQPAVYLGHMLGYLDYEFDETSEFGERFSRLAADHNLLISRNHGHYSFGRVPGEAFFRSYFLRQACEIQLKAMATGSELHLIPDAEAQRFQQQMYASPHYNYDGATEWPGLIRKLNRECPGYDR